MAKFYIPRRRSPLLDIAGLALRYADIKQRGELTKRELHLRERASKAEYGYGDETGGETGLAYRREARAQRGTDIAERYVGIAEREAERKGQTATAQWERQMSEAPQPANLIALKDNAPMFAPAINTILEGIQNGEIESRWDAYHLLKQNETIHLKVARDQVEKEITKLTKEGKHTQAAQMGQLYNALKPGFLEDFFGFPKEFREKRGELDIEVPKEGKLYSTQQGLLPAAEAKGKMAFTAPSKEGPTTGKRERRITAQEIRETEELILSNPDEEAIKPHIDFFNQFANKPYMYMWVEQAKRFWPDVAESQKIELPKDKKGKQVTAREVYETARNRGMTIEQVLQLIGAI